MEIQKVSDWSQSWKIGIFILFALGALGLYFLDVRPAIRNGWLGGSVFDPSFSNATNTAVTCGGTTPATVIQATTTNRTCFGASLTGMGTQVFICRDNTCAANQGLALVSSSPNYIQEDSYFGPYACQAAASTTISTWLCR